METNIINIRDYHWNNWCQKKNKYSQHGEELVIEYLFKFLPIFHKYCIEFGAKDGSWFSNTKRLRDEGWNSLLIDGEPNNPEVKQEFVTKENIIDLFRKYNVPKNPDLLSIDIDGNDIYVCDKILEEYEPTLIVIETNQYFPFGVSKAIKYDPTFTFGYDIYYGASVTAMDKMFAKHNYIGIHLCAINMFAIPAKYYYLIRQHILPLSYTVTACFKVTERVAKFIDYPPNEKIINEYKSSRRNFHKYPNTCLIESGTYLGEGVNEALECGFEKVISYEIEPKLYEKAKYKFKDINNVKLFNKSSVKMGDELKNMREDTITFWLDGHYSAGTTGYDSSNFYPLLHELEIIKQNQIKNSVIMIDDRRLMKHSIVNDSSVIGCNEDEVISILREINPYYRIKYEDGYIPKDIIVAYLPYISIELSDYPIQLYQVFTIISISLKKNMIPIFRKGSYNHILRNLIFIEESRYKYIEFKSIKEDEIQCILTDEHILLQGEFKNTSYFEETWKKIIDIMKLDENDINNIKLSIPI